ncbi:S-layer homology domain-containing protein [Acidaminobacterium chupaoyuni]|mgnify:CR=1 FL=1
MKKRIFCFLLAALMMGSTFIFAAGTSRFKDVPNNFWATESIEALASGGLVSGYGNGKFGPYDTFQIDHMATIICNAKGYTCGEKDGYWAYGALDYCINTLKCLPSQGNITSVNYDKACSRELAIYMLMKALGPNATEKYRAVEATDIPDFASISEDFRQTILEAYRFGITIGVDNKGTFNPKSNLTRAQIAVMMHRAGYTKAAQKPETTETTATNPQLYEKIKTLGVWTESQLNSCQILTAKDPKYGRLEVTYSNSTGKLFIEAPETNRSVWFKDANTMVDVNGKKVEDELNSAGVMVCSTGFGYEARQLTLKVLKIIYPKSYMDAYGAFKSALMEEAYEYGFCERASTLRWYDGRTFLCELSGYPSNIYSITISEANDTANYNQQKSVPASGMRRSFPYYIGSKEKAAIAYEYSKW